ncbi:MAG TPA: AMP-binding protein [Acidimicrobiales bacterium]|jgi:acyl-CoA synthetase (AMP-forming)/AMP-acid ligase II|nr:AMP-binding protein [Acidimicrobiales bacterium]
MNIVMLLEMAAEGMGDRLAVGTRDQALTYAQLLDEARRGAGALQAAGVERSGVVAVNSASIPVQLFASAIAGVPFSPINYRLADDRLRAIVGRLAPAVVEADDDAVARIAGIDGVEVLSHDQAAARLATAEPVEDAHTDPDAVAIWLFTSGTTGDPKVALLRHRHLVAYVLSTVEYMAAGEHEASLVSVPPYHIAGMMAILSATYSGRRIVYLPQFDPDEWVRIAQEEDITHAMVVPTMLGRVLDAIERRGTTLPALAHLSYGGGRMPVSIVSRAMDLLPHVGFVNAYGLTETSSTIAVLGPADHREAHDSNDPSVVARLGSVGRPLPILELEIRDPDGKEVATGETGEIWVRGEQIAGEYLERNALTDDGWFPTNDAGYLDAAGFLFVEGRLDDVIVRGGENISPGEVEDVLLQHEAVAEVAVVGVPDDEWGEVVAAAVVLTDGGRADEAELQEWVRTQLRSSRVPARVDIRRDLPYNETGKLLRRVLKGELS